MTNKTIYRLDYQPPAFLVDSITLDVDLYEHEVIVKNTMVLSRQHEGELILDGDGLELISIARDHHALSADLYQLDEKRLVIKACPDIMTLHIVTRIFPKNNTQLSGLYYANGLFCTQCEAEGFRRITFYPDRPDVLSVFTTRISADKTRYPVLLSNGHLVGEGELPEGRHWALWSDPFKKPAYLFALVAGNLNVVTDRFVTQSGRDVTLKIYVEPGHEHQCDHAMTSVKNAMRWDEVEYGREYDLDLFMIVAVNDFNMGAMENKGLNIFNSKYILAQKETATDEDFADIEGVVGHEYFHNWTGNRVTCRDWFQLSLKEGLTVFRDQEFSRDMNSRDVNRIRDVQTLLNAQFPEDASAMAHPVRPESYQEINNFYTATIYNKGAEVIRMQQTLLSKAGFRRGMDLYFDRHDGQAVTIDDFVAAMEDANEIDLTQFKLWYSQAGTPTVEISTEWKDRELILTMTQSCRATSECAVKQPFHIPVRAAFFSVDGQPIHGQPELLELKQPTQTFRLSGFQEKPLVSFLRDFSAPVTLKLDYDETRLLGLLRYESNGYAKWDAARQLILNGIHAMMNDARDNWRLPRVLLDALTYVLQDERLDPALKAELLSAPMFEECAAGLTNLDVDVLQDVRDFYAQSLGSHLFDAFQLTWLKLTQDEQHELSGDAFGRRQLKNLCLYFMMKAKEDVVTPLCSQQFTSAGTMTDQLKSFALLAHAQDQGIRRDSVNRFYQQWQHDPLVLDKWFAIQAMRDAPDVLDDVKQLMKHTAFSIKNPNKVRALLSSFTMANPRQFHHPTGTGYAFLTAQLIVLDSINPQIAARLAAPFTRWARYDAPRQRLMKDALQALAKQSLSKDLMELVGKSLDTK